jgi:PhnB protein
MSAATAQANPQQQQSEAMIGLAPYLSVRDASGAIAFYERAFGAEVLDVRRAEDGKRVMHGRLRINGGTLMLSDFFPEYGHAEVPHQGYNLHLQVDDAQAWWDRAVKAGATVTMPMKVEFWGDRYGQLRDPFGVAWAIGGAAK